MDVLALGELLIDFIIEGPPQTPWRNIRGSAGGAPANVLAALARLGGTGGFIGKVGKDAFGDYLQASLQDFGIATNTLLRDPERTTLAFVTLDGHGERSFAFERQPGADTQLHPSDICSHWFEDTKIFHFGSLSLTHHPAREATYRALEYAKAANCVISFDPNLRAPLWSDLEEAKQLMLEGVRNADIVKVADNEVLFLTGSHALQDGVTRLVQYNPSAVFLVTKGDEGADLVVDGQVVSVAPLPVMSVDTTAAGDAFFGTVLYALTRETTDEKIREKLRDIEQLKPMVRMANIAGALTTTKPGAFRALPTLSEIEIHL